MSCAQLSGVCASSIQRAAELTFYLPRLAPRGPNATPDTQNENEPN